MCSDVLFTETHRNFSVYKFHFIKNYNITWVHIPFFWQEAVLWSTVNTARDRSGSEWIYMPMGELVTMATGLAAGVMCFCLTWCQSSCWATQSALTPDRRIFSQMMIPWVSLLTILQKPATTGDPNRYQPLKSPWPWTNVIWFVIWFEQVHLYFPESHHSLPQCCLTHPVSRGD